MIQWYHSWASIWKTTSKDTIETLVHSCLLQPIHNSQAMETAQKSYSWWLDLKKFDTHIMEYYWATKKNEIMLFPGKQ
jgi:hypothetical protein